MINWYEMPIHLRGLPFDERPAALAEYEKKHGQYDWRKDWYNWNKRHGFGALLSITEGNEDEG